MSTMETLFKNIENNLAMTRMDARNVDDDIIIFLSVYKAPPYDCVHQFLRISKKKYEMADRILWMLVFMKKKETMLKNIFNYLLKVTSLMLNIQLEMHILLFK